MTLPLHVFLALASFFVIAVVIAQDYLIPALRQKSISSGLTGPYHWYLDASFLVLAVALAWAFKNGTHLQHALSFAAAVMLVFTGASGTWTNWLDLNTHGDGEKIHAGCTAVTFVLAILLQVVSNHTASMWGMTGLGIACAAATHFLVANASVTEKVGVLGLCAWLIAV